MANVQRLLRGWRRVAVDGGGLFTLFPIVTFLQGLKPPILRSLYVGAEAPTPLKAWKLVVRGGGDGLVEEEGLEAGDGGDGFVEDEEEPIDDHAGDGDVEPERERPASDFFVAQKLRAESERESDEDQGHDDDGENGMRGQNREIDGTDDSLAREANDPGVEMEIDVGDEKGGGASDGGKHAEFVGKNLAAANHEVARGGENGARAVETGVQGREERERGGSHAGGNDLSSHCRDLGYASFKCNDYPSGAEAPFSSETGTARLKPCPDTSAYQVRVS